MIEISDRVSVSVDTSSENTDVNQTSVDTTETGPTRTARLQVSDEDNSWVPVTQVLVVLNRC